ncbi:MAG: hypothetical protein M3406_14535 [Chloroflexota bacterium]|nr:hypothetical protein [Chloroflexota bacterium]
MIEVEGVPSDSAAWAAFAQAQEQLAQHPSVRSIELGWKVSGGQLQSELAIRVYVDHKLPLTEVPPELEIPSQIAGLPTDVLALRDERFVGHDMTGGDKITRIVWNEPGTASGTLACIATRVADSKPVMLSNQHVLRSDLGGDERRREVYQPDISCQALGSNCNYVGYVKDGHIADFAWSQDGTDPIPHFIDCAIAEVDDADFRRGVKELATISGSLDISASPSGPSGGPLAVKKIGARTGLTEGVVVSVNSTGHQKIGPFEIEDQPLTILIRVTSGKQFSKEYDVPPGEKASIAQAFRDLEGPGTVTELAGNRLRFDVPMFSDEGDSGSAIVTAAGGGIVGLLYASLIFVFPVVDGSEIRSQAVPLGESRACHIGPVMSRLGIRIDPSTAPSAATEPPAVRVGFGTRDERLANRIAAMERQLTASRGGQMLRSIVRDHGLEMVDLVHHRRRVTAVWHRHEGPAFAVLAVEAIRDPERPIPAEHRGVTLAALITAMSNVLLAEGSAALRAAVQQNREWVLEWISSSDRLAGLLAVLAHKDPRTHADAAYV